MTALARTLVDKYAEKFEANLIELEDMYEKNNGKTLPRKSLYFWMDVELRRILQKYGEEIRKLKK